MTLQNLRSSSAKVLDEMLVLPASAQVRATEALLTNHFGGLGQTHQKQVWSELL
jgi:hypothetical protein